MFLGESSPWLRFLSLRVIAPLALVLHSKSASALDLVCPRIGATDSGTRLRVDDPNGQDFIEISGSGLSSIQTAPSGEPVLFVVNDKGGGARLGVYDSGNGERLLTLGLNVLPSSNDWESMAIGSCGNYHGTCIFIADVGDNSARKAGGASSIRGTEPYRIYKVREPILENFQDNNEIPAEDTEILEFNYLHASSTADYADCEAVFLDHTGWGGSIGDLYLVTKWNGRKTSSDSFTKTRLFHIPTSAWDSRDIYSPAVVGSYDGGGDLVGRTWTRADMSLDGTLIALGTVNRSYLFPRCPGTSVADALTGGAASCYDWKNPNSRGAKQYETFAWASDGAKNLQIAESGNPILGWTKMDYNNPATTITCPEFQPKTTPTSSPTRNSTMQPTPSPTMQPTPNPTSSPTRDPTMQPTHSPTMQPTPNPTWVLTRQPRPTPTSSPTRNPTIQPTHSPTMQPTQNPTSSPTRNPTMQPTPDPTLMLKFTRQPRPTPIRFENKTSIGGIRGTLILP